MVMAVDSDRSTRRVAKAKAQSSRHREGQRAGTLQNVRIRKQKWGMLIYLLTTPQVSAQPACWSRSCSL